MRCPDCGEKFEINAVINKADSLFKGYCRSCKHIFYLDVRLFLTPHLMSFDHLIMTFVNIKNEKQNNS